MNTDHATNFLFAVDQLQFRFSCGVNALGAIHTAMEEGSSSPSSFFFIFYKFMNATKLPFVAGTTA